MLQGLFWTEMSEVSAARREDSLQRNAEVRVRYGSYCCRESSRLAADTSDFPVQKGLGASASKAFVCR